MVFLLPKGFSRDEANVENVAAAPATLTRTIVTWQVSNINCDVFGYNIYYYSQTSGMRNVSRVYGGDVNRFTLDDLEAGVIYDISVAALQMDRELPEVGPVTGKSWIAYPDSGNVSGILVLLQFNSR